jgi:hypothetical protein
MGGTQQVQRTQATVVGVDEGHQHPTVTPVVGAVLVVADVAVAVAAVAVMEATAAAVVETVAMTAVAAVCTGVCVDTFLQAICDRLIQRARL